MNKKTAIKSLQDVRKYHEYEMKRLSMILDSKEVGAFELNSKKECNFGQWFYSEDNHLKEIIGLQFYENLELLHCSWYSQYHKIYMLLFSDKNSGFFSKLIASSEKSMNLDKAKSYYHDLKIISDKLIKSLCSCERRLTALNESKFH